mgnify:CR=1 FL=1
MDNEQNQNKNSRIIDVDLQNEMRKSFLDYSMSVIVSRALPEIDGFKPAHRKLLYTMYGMGLLKGARTKSANIVGSTMHLNPHGDAAIYDTMVRMGRGNESLLVPFVDSKATLARRTAGICPAPLPVIPRPSSRESARNCSGISIRRPWTLCPTTTAPPPSRPCCP